MYSIFVQKSSVYKGYGRTFFEREWLLRKPFVKKINYMEILVLQGFGLDVPMLKMLGDMWQV